MNPGVTSRFDASMRSAPEGTRIEADAPAAVIVFPSTINRPGENFIFGVKSVPASMASSAVLLTSASEVAEHAAKISIPGSELLLGFLSIASNCAHDHGNF